MTVKILPYLIRQLKPAVVVISYLVCVAFSYASADVVKTSPVFGFIVWTTVLLAIFLLRGQKAKGHEIWSILYSSRIRSNLFVYLGLALLAIKIFKDFGLLLGLQLSISTAYNSAQVLRDRLYEIRSSYFDGLIEYSYMILIGSFLVPANLNYRSTKISLACCLGIFLIAGLEIATLSRFYSPTLLLTCLVFLNILYTNKGLVNKYTFNIFCSIVLAMLMLATAPLAIRAIQYRQITPLWADSATMSEGIAMREDPDRRIFGLSTKSTISMSDVKLRWKENRGNITPPKTRGLANDFACSLITGPYLENKLCSGYMHEWLNTTKINYYSGVNGPVLTTGKYWMLGGLSVHVIILANWLLIVAPLLYVVLHNGVNSLFLQSWMLSIPLFGTKLISFFRGDPLHSGINYIWFFMACYCLLYLCSRNYKSNCK